MCFVTKYSIFDHPVPPDNTVTASFTCTTQVFPPQRSLWLFCPVYKLRFGAACLDEEKGETSSGTYCKTIQPDGGFNDIFLPDNLLLSLTFTGSCHRLKKKKRTYGQFCRKSKQLCIFCSPNVTKLAFSFFFFVAGPK